MLMYVALLCCDIMLLWKWFDIWFFMHYLTIVCIRQISIKNSNLFIFYYSNIIYMDLCWPKFYVVKCNVWEMRMKEFLFDRVWLCHIYIVFDWTDRWVCNRFVGIHLSLKESKLNIRKTKLFFTLYGGLIYTMEESIRYTTLSTKILIIDFQNLQ